MTTHDDTDISWNELPDDILREIVEYIPIQKQFMLNRHYHTRYRTDILNKIRQTSKYIYFIQRVIKDDNHELFNYYLLLDVEKWARVRIYLNNKDFNWGDTYLENFLHLARKYNSPRCLDIINRLYSHA